MEKSRGELVEAIADELKVPIIEVDRVVSALIADVLEVTAADGNARWPVFGVFHRETAKARKRRHPKTGAIKVCAARVELRFRASLKLKKKVKA